MHYQSKSAVVTALTGPHTAIVHLDPSGRERCSGCAVASVCGVGTAADDFEVAVSAGVSVEPGDRVEIAAAASLTRRESSSIGRGVAVVAAMRACGRGGFCGCPRGLRDGGGRGRYAGACGGVCRALLAAQAPGGPRPVDDSTDNRLIGMKNFLKYICQFY